MRCLEPFDREPRDYRVPSGWHTRSRWSWRAHLGWLALALAASGLVAPAEAQTVPPDVLRQLDTLIGNKVETMAVLGSQSGMSAGTYLLDANDSVIDVLKFTGRGDVGGPRAIGDSGIGWNPVFEGGIGFAKYDNRFNTGELAGNADSIDTLSVSLGAGVRFTFLEHFSLAPMFGIIYSHTENEFKARTDTGQAALAQLDGTFVNWDADVITFVPGIEGRYRQRFGPVTIELSSVYRDFETQPIRRSTEALSFESHSQWWRNRLDVDFRLPLYAFGRQFPPWGND